MSETGWPGPRRPLTPSPGPSPRPTPPSPTAMPSAQRTQGSAEGTADPAAPPTSPAPRPGVVETGHPGVDTALARLAGAGDVPAEARAEVYGEVHDLLRDTLAGLDERPAGPPSPSHLNR